MSGKNYHREVMAHLELRNYNAEKLVWWIAKCRPAVFCAAVRACSDAPTTPSASKAPQVIRLVALRTVNKLAAIKALHNAVPGLGLHEAKRACDLIEIGTPYTLPDDCDSSIDLGSVFEIR